MAAPDVIPAVIYAAKSTEDHRGSIPTQLADCREHAPGAPQFSDEAASAYHGNRGQGLTDARDATIRLAADHGACELWVQHSDRLARGRHHRRPPRRGLVRAQAPRRARAVGAGRPQPR
jgi:Resolvase, N terminal domain